MCWPSIPHVSRSQSACRTASGQAKFRGPTRHDRKTLHPAVRKPVQPGFVRCCNGLLRLHHRISLPWSALRVNYTACAATSIELCGSCGTCTGILPAIGGAASMQFMQKLRHLLRKLRNFLDEITGENQISGLVTHVRHACGTL